MKKILFRKVSILLFFAAAYLILPLKGYSIGFLDQSFGSGGVLVSDLGSESSVKDLYQQSDGKIIVVGKNNGSIILLRYNINGSLDTTFGIGGKVVTSYSSGDAKINFTIQTNGVLAVGNNTSVTRYTTMGTVSETISFPTAETAGFGIEGKIATASLINANGTCPVAQQSKKIDYKEYNPDGSPSNSVQFCAEIGGSTGVTSIFRIVPKAAGSFYVGYTEQASNASSGAVTTITNGAVFGAYRIGFGAISDEMIDLARTEDGGFATLTKVAYGYSSRGQNSYTFNTCSQCTPLYSRIHAKTLTAILRANSSLLVLNRYFKIAGNTDTGRFFGAATEQSDVYVQSDDKILVGGQLAAANGYKSIGLVRYAKVVSQSVLNADFDGDDKSDVAIFRPSNGTWYTSTDPAANYGAVQFGVSTDKLVPADYDGDGKTDVAVYRSGVWYVQQSSQGFNSVQFGTSGDIPVPADYNGDGKADVAVFRPSNGTWYIQRSYDNQFSAVQFGQSGDKPVAADYDGDGLADVAVNRAGVWYIQPSTGGFRAVQFGNSDDKLVPADYDGDGKADVAVFRSSDGTWYVQQSTAGFTGTQFGLGTDIPVPADYDGDGKTDIAVVRNGIWYIQRSTLGSTAFQFGTADDLPVPNAFVR